MAIYFKTFKCRVKISEKKNYFNVKDFDTALLLKY